MGASLGAEDKRAIVAGGGGGAVGGSWEYSLRKYLLLLATLVATITYTAGFNPPGGVWQDTDEAAGHLAGDPIIRDTSYRRYLAFFYTNATAFASSLVVIVLILILSVLQGKKKDGMAPLVALRIVMVLDLFSLMAAYAAGTCRDKLTVAYSSALALIVIAYVCVQMIWALWMKWDNGGKHPEQHNKGSVQNGSGGSSSPRNILETHGNEEGREEENHGVEEKVEGPKEEENKAHSEPKNLQKKRKMLMLLATFAASVTYLAGLSAPGGFWDHSEGGHRPGVAILKGRYDARLKIFFIFNTTAFMASLLIIVLLLEKKLRLPNKVRFHYLCFLSSICQVHKSPPILYLLMFSCFLPPRPILHL